MEDNLNHIKNRGLPLIPKKRKKLTTLREKEKIAKNKRASVVASKGKSSSTTTSATIFVSTDKETNPVSNITASTQLRVTRSTSAGSSRSEPKTSNGTSITKETPSSKQGSAIAKFGLPTRKRKKPMRMANTPYSEDDFIPQFTKSSGETIKKFDIISKDDELLLTVAGNIWTKADFVQLSNVNSEEKNRLCVSHAIKSAHDANGVLQDNILLRKDLANKDKMVSSLSKEIT